MTFISADPLLSAAGLRAGRRQAAIQWPGLPPRTIFLESGRVALWAALRALGLESGDRLVVPAYICDSILPAPAALGVEVAFIGTDRGPRPDLAAIERALREGARAVLVVHYFGFPATEVEDVRELCARYGAGLIEDCAQALFSQDRERPLGSTGAAAIFSAWKSLPLPDGGALVLNGPDAPGGLGRLPRPAAGVTARRLAYRGVGVLETALGRSPRLWLLRSGSLRRRMQARMAEAVLVPRRASRLAEAIVRGTDWRAVVARRRGNYARLAAALDGVGWARLLEPELPPGCCPLGLPILVEERERARRALLGAGVNVRAYWERLPAAVRVETFGDAHYLADRILVLPVHQSLTQRQLCDLPRILGRVGVA